MKIKTDDVLKDLTTYEDYNFNTIFCNFYHILYVGS